VEEIKEAYSNVESELKSNRRDLKESLSSDGFQSLKEHVERQVELAVRDVDKVLDIRQEKLNELETAARRQAKDDPDVFERVSAQIEVVHPEGIANDIQEATQFDGVVENYLGFAERLQRGSLTSKVAAQYTLQIGRAHV